MTQQPHRRVRLSGVLATGALLLAAGAFGYVAVGLAQDGPPAPAEAPSGPPPVATPTPTIPAPAANSEAAALTTLGRSAAVAAVAAAAKTGDADQLIQKVARNSKPCKVSASDHGAGVPTCVELGLKPGDTVQLISVGDVTDVFVTTEYARALLGTTIGQGGARLVFAVERADGSLGLAFATAPVEFDDINLAGVWLEVNSTGSHPVTKLHLLTPVWGPQQLYQELYQVRGGTVIFNDVAGSPGVKWDQVPAPPPPPRDRP